MAPPIIRPARRDEVPALHALIERAYRGDTARAGWTHEADLLTDPRTDAATLAAIFVDRSQLLLVAADGAVLVGCVHLRSRPPRTADLGLLTVDPQRQAAGIGRTLLAAAEDAARQRLGVRRIELTVVAQRAELIAYYQRRGYVPTGETRPFPVPLDPPFRMTVLAKPLA